MNDNDHYLTANFKASEFYCKCGKCGGGMMAADFMEKLQMVRMLYRKPMIITSGFRCNNYNMAIKGQPGSQHLLGRAADIHVADSTERYILAALAFQVGMTGIGIDKTFIHMDLRKEDRRRLWLY